jgi:hypothetical protein
VGWLAAAGLALAGQATAQSPAPDVTAPTATPVGEMAQATQRAARATTEWLARRIDGWFGTETHPDVERVRDGRLDIGLFKRQDQPASLDLRFDASVRLPNLKQSAYLFLGRDDRREAVQDTPDATSLRQRLLAEERDDRSFLAGLGLTLPSGLDWRFGLGSRLKPYTQLRWRHAWQPSAKQRVELRETLFWTPEDRGGSTTALRVDTALAPAWTLRWLSAATLTEVSRRVEWSSSLSAERQLPGQRLISAEVLFVGTGRPGSGRGASDAGLLLKWDQPVHEDGLRGELVVGHFWPRPDAQSARGRAWALGASLRLRF